MVESPMVYINVDTVTYDVVRCILAHERMTQWSYRQNVDGTHCISIPEENYHSVMETINKWRDAAANAHFEMMKHEPLHIVGRRA